MTDRHYLLRRCLRLEARILALKAQLQGQRPSRQLICPRRPRRRTSDADRAQIRALHAQGASPYAIARETGWSRWVVYRVINAPLSARAVGE